MITPNMVPVVPGKRASALRGINFIVSLADTGYGHHPLMCNPSWDIDRWTQHMDSGGCEICRPTHVTTNRKRCTHP